MFNWNKKEAPLLGLQGSGGGLGFLSPKGGKPIVASGGTKTTVGSYTIHTFSHPNSQNFVVDPTSGEDTIDILVVAGGGGGGGGGPAQWQGGGGGAGGYAYVTGYTITAGTTYPVQVGTGGPAASPGSRGGFGTSSWFNLSGPGPIFCQGGGGGGVGNQSESPNAPGLSGGSGGGSGAHLNTSTTPGGTAVQPAQNPGFSNGTLVQGGFDGGREDGGTGDGVGGGGGGAGGAGQHSPGGSANGQGGPGVPNTISGTDVTYAAGGAGNGYPYPGSWPVAISTAAGAGGNGGSPDGFAPVAGQPGIVIVRYLT